MDTFAKFKCQCPTQCVLKLNKQDLEREIERHFMLKQSERRVMCQSMLACCVTRLKGAADGKDDVRRAKRAHVALEASESEEPRPQKTQFVYTLLGQKICKKTFMRILCVGGKIMKHAQSGVGEGTVYPPSMKRGQNRKGISSPRRILAGIFLESMAKRDALPDPTGRGSKPDKPIMFFPPSYSAKRIYRDYYLPSLVGQEDKPLKYWSFLVMWRTFHPHIRIRNPRTDICKTCDDLRLLRDQVSLTLHREVAVAERTFYNQSVKDTRDAVAVGNNDTIQLTFDYAQKILLPLYNGEQPGPIFYIAGLKMDLFGIANNTAGLQHNFVLPEGQWPEEKTSSPICSMLSYYIDTHLPQVKYLKLMADNCSGQNKNRWILWFFAWLVITRPEIELIDYSFLIVGHTKNFCDACFGLCKRSLKGKNLLVPEDVIACFAKSAKCNRVVTADAVVWCDWKAFLEQFFVGVLQGIMGMQHFRFAKDNPGVLEYKQLVTSPVWKDLKLLKKGIIISMIQDPVSHGLKTLESFKYPIEKVELSEARRAYLDKEVVKEYFVGTRATAGEKYFKVK